MRHSGVISRSLVRCCRFESSLKHFIFFARRRVYGWPLEQQRRKQVSEPRKGIGCSGVLLTRECCDGLVCTYVSSYRIPRARVLAGQRRTASVSYHWQASSLLCLLLFTNSAMYVRTINLNRAVSVFAIDTLKRLYDFPYRPMCTTGYIQVHARAYVRVRTGWPTGVHMPVDGTFLCYVPYLCAYVYIRTSCGKTTYVTHGCCVSDEHR